MPTHPHAPRDMPAPLSNEPDALRVVFNAARRKAFYNLVCSITAYMRSQLELERRHEEEEEGGEGGGGNEGDQGSTPPPPYTATDADGEGSSSGGNARPQPRQDGGGLSSPALVRLRRAALLHFDSWRAETLSKLKEVAAKPDDQRIVDARRKRAEELNSSAKAREEEDRRRRRNGGSGSGNGGGGGSSSSAGDLLVFDDADAPAEGKHTNSNSNSGSSNNSGGGGGISGSNSSSTAELEAFQELYHPIPTRLTTVPLRDREEALSATLLLLLSGGRYSAHSRALACHLASALGVAPSTLDGEERAIATTMAATARKASASASGSSGSSGSGTMSADAEAQRRRDEGRAGRLWKVGLASVAGAALVGVTGGLAAPVVAAAVGGLMSSVGLGGLAGFLGLFWMNGALVGTLFGAFGAKMTGEIADRYAKEVEDFRFLPLDAEWGEDWKDSGDDDGRAEAEARRRRLRVTIGVNGWLESEDDVTRPWRALGDETEVFALRYEMGSLTALGGRLRALVGSAAWGAARAQVLRRTALATLQGALWPVLLLRSAAAGVDNPFALARHRSDKAGRVLADALAARVQGERPVTLVGYSLGARVVWACLRALADRRAFGLVDSVVLIGAPVPSSPAHWAAARSVVAGRLVNVHSANDYVLGLLHRGTSLQLGVAGLQAVGGGGGGGVGGVEDLDLTDQVHGHLRYPGLIPQILHRCGFPNVKGGGAPIETEKEVAAEIELRDRDYAELGTLIDIGEEEEEETPPPPLPRRTVGDRLNDKFDPTVKNVLELKSDAQTRDAKLMGRGAAVSGLQKTGVATASSPSASDSLVGGGRERSASTSHSAAAGGQFQGHGAGGRDDDSDEYGEDQITMVDDDELSDGELTMVEPLSIDDDDPQT